MINGALQQRKAMSGMRDLIMGKTFEKWTGNSIIENGTKVHKENILRNWIQQL